MPKAKNRCISCEIISKRKIYSKSLLNFFRCRKSIALISNSVVDDVNGRSEALPYMCGFFCLTHGH